MSSLSDYLENKLALQLFNATAYTTPATMYAALHTSNPADDDSGTEVSGNGYARVAITTNDTNWTVTDDTAENATAITFPEATGSQGTVTHWGLYDASSSGNLLYHGALGSSKAIASGQTPAILPGAITITFA